MFVGTDIDEVVDPFVVSAERESRRMTAPLPLDWDCLEHQALCLLNMAQSAATATKPTYEERLRNVARLRAEAVRLVRGEDRVLTLLEENRLCLLVVPDPCDAGASRPRLGFVTV